MQEEKCLAKLIEFPPSVQKDWRNSLTAQMNQIEPGPIEINCRDWRLNCEELKQIESLAEKLGLKIRKIHSTVPESLISAAALGYETSLILPIEEKEDSLAMKAFQKSTLQRKLLFHQGTLRSGEHLEAPGDLLLLGDVNPGAKISAGGDVMVWGRLRGVAHAGKPSNSDARIVALELRPLQLRIAEKIARGPQEKTEPGLAEEALLSSDQIIIQPARLKASSNNS